MAMGRFWAVQTSAPGPGASLLEGIPPAQYAAIWCALNKGELPAAVVVRPANWESMLPMAQHQFAWPIMAEIMHAIGLKACLREWNRARMTDQEFEAWWQRSAR